MTTITQKGYDFVYRTTVPGQQPIVETWSIERVAGFLFLIEFHRQRSQKYVKGYTLTAAVGNIQYELGEFDKETYRDIDKLTRLLTKYSGEMLENMWLSEFNKGVDLAERVLKEKVANAEKPLEILGTVHPATRFYSRPTREEYETIQAKENAELAKIAGEDARIVRVWFPEVGILPCKVLKETASCLWVDAYANGKCLYSNRRLLKNTARIFEDKAEESK